MPDFEYSFSFFILDKISAPPPQPPASTIQEGKPLPLPPVISRFIYIKNPRPKWPPTEFYNQQNLTSRGCNLTYFGRFVHLDFNLLKKVARSLLLWG